MIQPAPDAYQFNLDHSQFVRIRAQAVLFMSVLIVCAGLTVMAGVFLWETYDHDFTPYLKWQDALVALCWFLAFAALGGSVLTGRFIHALHAGRREGMVIFSRKNYIIVRDLSPENLVSIFWIMNSAVWCFVAALVGLFPAILIGWTLQLSPLLAIITTAIAVLLSLAGLVVSIVACFFIIVGCIGLVSFSRKQGSSYHYQLNNQATVRIDNCVLTIIYPGKAESMIDLRLLSLADQRQLLDLLRERWMDSKQVWNPRLGEEIAQALKASEERVAVA